MIEIMNAQYQGIVETNVNIKRQALCANFKTYQPKSCKLDDSQ